MADNAQSKIQYDDFIASVQPDPAKPESTIMMSGYIGHGGDGVVRIYPDPSLGTWYDVPEGDVVHSMAMPDSKLGGSFIWVRAAADIKPGSTSASSAATGSGSGDAAVAAAAAPAAQAAPNFTIGAGCTFICAQPGPALQPTPATHCFICPSITQQCMQPTPTADVTLATICTQHHYCLQPTPTVHPSLATVCTQFCPTFHAGCLTLPINCFPITQPAVCTIAVSPNCPPPAPGTPVQQQGMAAAAMRLQPTPTVQTHCFVCPPHQTLDTLCTLPPGCPITQQCSAATYCSPLNQCGHHPTAVTICTETCNTLLLGCGHHPTAATICTETCNTMLVGCWQTLPAHCFPITLPQVCNVAVSPNCPLPLPGTPMSEVDCGAGVQQGQQQFAAAAAIQPTPTAQSHCFVCPPITLQQQCVRQTLPQVCGVYTVPPVCPHPTLPTACTQHCTVPFAGCYPSQLIFCGPHITQPQICNVAISPNCPGPGPGTPVQQPGVMAAAMQPTPSAINQCGVHTAATVCTQPPACHPSVNVICPTPSAVHQCGPNTAATVCTQPPACHPSVNVICPTPSAVHQCGGQTAATVCTQLPACHPSVNVICPTPSAVHQCGVFTPYGR